MFGSHRPIGSEIAAMLEGSPYRNALGTASGLPPSGLKGMRIREGNIIAREGCGDTTLYMFYQGL